MLAPTCPSCGRRALLGSSRILRLESADRRHDLVLRCRCGAAIHHRAGATSPRA